LYRVGRMKRVDIGKRVARKKTWELMLLMLVKSGRTVSREFYLYLENRA